MPFVGRWGRQDRIVHPIEVNLDLVQAMLGEAQDYLASPELYWPLSGSAPAGAPAYPRLTLGGLILAMDELRASEPRMDSRQAAAWSRLISTWDTLWVRRAAGVAHKAALELHSRLDLWDAYLGDLREPAGATADYATQVAYRVMASRLAELARGEPTLPVLLTRLTGLDDRLRGSFASGRFIWDAALESIYPRKEFWFLYGRPV